MDNLFYLTDYTEELDLNSTSIIINKNISSTLPWQTPLLTPILNETSPPVTLTQTTILAVSKTLPIKTHQTTPTSSSLPTEKESLFGMLRKIAFDFA